MKRLTFDIDKLQEVIDYARLNPLRDKDDNTLWQGGYGSGRVEHPTVLLVGDQGVYYIPGGSGVEYGPIAYAKECNPDTCDEWYENKRDTWGGDDGCESMDAEDLEKMIQIDNVKNLVLEFTENEIKYILTFNK